MSRLSATQELRAWPIIGDIAASDGAEAVKEAPTLLPDVVLLDVGMPQLNGIEGAKRIRQASRESKIIFLTRESDSEATGAALAGQLRASGYD